MTLSLKKRSRCLFLVEILKWKGLIHCVKHDNGCCLVSVKTYLCGKNLDSKEEWTNKLAYQIKERASGAYCLWIIFGVQSRVQKVTRNDCQGMPYKIWIRHLCTVASFTKCHSCYCSKKLHCSPIDQKITWSWKLLTGYVLLHLPDTLKSFLTTKVFKL